jgi:hypothetical protein
MGNAADEIEPGEIRARLVIKSEPVVALQRGGNRGVKTVSLRGKPASC